MGKRARTILMVLLVAVFLGCGCFVLWVMGRYRMEDQVYDQAAEAFQQDAAEGDTGGSGGSQSIGSGKECAPIVVDFDGLLEICGDVTGWIYCEDTPINYPVVQGEDNDYYLRRSYEGTSSTAGSIFVDANNHRNFVDSNTIIYGHHMKNGSMFACLDKWEDQDFYEEHPVMWLLTPEQDYKIVLFSGYTTPATSDTYRIFEGPSPELDEYLWDSVAQSDFRADVELDGQGRYVLLSTCAYVYTDARHVLHGMLVPVDSAGGVEIQ